MIDTVEHAVVLAAGNGRRIASGASSPKPLVRVAGRALLEHVIAGLTDLGIRRVTVVVGYRADEIRSHSFDSLPSGIELEWVSNPRFHLANGISLLSAREKVGGPFLLLMSDHLFQSGMLEGLIHEGGGAAGAILAVDTKIDQIFDLDDATKVLSRDGHLRRIGKDLRRFNAIDTGAFLLTPTVFRAMDDSAAAGDGSLSGGIARLAETEGVRTWDIGPLQWLDVDTPEALAQAERMFGHGTSGKPAGNLSAVEKSTSTRVG